MDEVPNRKASDVESAVDVAAEAFKNEKWENIKVKESCV